MDSIIKKARELVLEINKFKQTGKPATHIFEEHGRNAILSKNLFENISNDQWMDMAVDNANSLSSDNADIMNIEVPSDFEAKLMVLIQKSKCKNILTKYLKSILFNFNSSDKGYISYTTALLTLEMLIDYEG